MGQTGNQNERNARHYVFNDPYGDVVDKSTGAQLVFYVPYPILVHAVHALAIEQFATNDATFTIGYGARGYPSFTATPDSDAYFTSGDMFGSATAAPGTKSYTPVNVYIPGGTAVVVDFVASTGNGTYYATLEYEFVNSTGTRP